MASLDLQDALELRDPTPEAIVPCTRVLAARDSDPWDVAEILDKFREWLRRDIGHAQRLLGNAKLPAQIVQSVNLHCANLEVARLGCGVIAGCCQRSVRNADIMLQAGVVKVIHHLMVSYLEDGIVQDNACVALWRLAEQSGKVAEAIIKANGITRLQEATKAHKRNPFVQVNACIAMERLYIRGNAPPDGMAAIAEQAMEGHPSNTQIKRGAQRLLEIIRAPRAQPSTNKCKLFPSTSTKLSFYDWLLELDELGFLMEYHNVLIKHFKSLEQVLETYAPSGQLEPRFFCDMGVRKLGHRRLFEKWCRDTLKCHSPQPTA